MAHTILVAFAVNGTTREEAEQTLMGRLPNPESDCHETIDCWWIAEDDRIDGSDNDSAVFVPKGTQAQWQRAVKAYGDLQP
jgi:hypothetical protein